MIGIIDYGAGNLLSVKKAFDFLKVESVTISSADEFTRIEKMVLPGVGAFNASMLALKARGLHNLVVEWIQADKPFLGICVGLQMLFEESDEFGTSAGLGLLPGRVPKFRQGKVPQIGWNQVKQSQESPLWEGIADDAFFYFVHSYYIDTPDPSITIGQTEYYITYTSAVNNGRCYAVQFHPEKSGALGMKLLDNWVNLS
ncbi:imidazole glycerol phosphate synthase subunit HisH [candidate division KSB3 bacterium]|uniref:Imidazole glycerol phosphate synthase subunit HisH n=1 Tax=candidate division KSB3 bacterium TaxID=2044937 RepID=A0A2G6E408_9BACT|nr:MAG: imidazole glycerol phosphate synthase subunit HisH [candidate division KSB3 bacterium]PIE29149.1 MAG: imidazole glycerol phosphate synthase subunit HisH [candidate division KSB3 bacterium]